MKKRAILFFMLICAVMILPFSVSATVEKTEFVQSTLSGDNSALKLYFSGKIEENAKVVIGNDTFDCEITENVPIRTVFLIDNTTSMSKVTNVVDIVRDYLSAISENESIAIVKFDKKTEQVTNGYIKDKYDIDTAFSKIKFDGEGSYIYDAIVETIKTMYENNNDYYKIVLITDGFDQSKSVSFDNLKNEVEKNARYHIDVVQATNYNQESKELKAIGALSTNTYTFCNNSKSNGSKTYNSKDISKLAVSDVTFVKVYLKESVTTGEYKGVTLKNGENNVQIGSVLFPQADWSKEDLEAKLNAKAPSLNIPLIIGICAGVILLAGCGVLVFILIRNKNNKVKKFDITVEISKDSDKDNSDTGRRVWTVSEKKPYRVGRVLKPMGSNNVVLPENDSAICENASEESKSSIGRNAFEIFYDKENDSLVVKNNASNAEFYLNSEDNVVKPNASFTLKAGMNILLGLYTTVKIINIEPVDNKKKK